jgi:CubicO group peptidase (beta-lactamase class C family)
MRISIIIILNFFSFLSFGQEEQPANKRITEQFIDAYNAGDYELIFNMYADPMKEALPLDQSTGFLSTLNAQVGTIISHTFIQYEQGTYASYKVDFEQAPLSLNISIDTLSNINGLFVKPYTEPVDTTSIVNNLNADQSDFTKEQLELVFDQMKVFPNNTQLSIAMINDGKVLFYGAVKQKDSISFVDNKLGVFEIGSISKVFTATLLAQFVVEGKLSLKDDINDYLTAPIKDNTVLLFEELSNHSSGLPRLPTNLDLTSVDLTNPYKTFDEQAIKSYLKEYLDLSGKGSYQYSNLGAGLLGYTLSDMEQTSYDQLLQDRIFSKLDMQASTSKLEQVETGLIRGLNTQGDEVSNWDLAILAGAGGIMSNVEDLSKFALSQFDASNEAQALTRVKTISLNESMDMGLGWHILRKQADVNLFFHNGATGGYTSSMVVNTASKDGLIILSNVSPEHPNMGNVDDLCFLLMETLSKGE